jgi:hypothetical protein
MSNFIYDNTCLSINEINLSLPSAGVNPRGLHDHYNKGTVSA